MLSPSAAQDSRSDLSLDCATGGRASELERAERLRRLVHEHFAAVWRFLRRFGFPVHVADDAAQDLFLIAFRKVDTIAPGRERAFLFGVAYRVAIEQKRKTAREVPLDVLLDMDDEPADGSATPEERLDEERARVVLHQLLAELDPRLRAVFVMHELEGMSSQEIATALEIPAGTVASRLRTARDDFRARLERHRARERRRVHMRKAPILLVHEDPGFARLAAASQREEPSSEQIEKALANATRSAAGAPSSTPWWQHPGLALAVTAAGAVVVGVLAVPGRPSVPTSPIQPTVVPAPASNEASPALPIEPTVKTVAVGDLAPAPSARVRPRSVEPSAPVRPAASSRGDDAVGQARPRSTEDTRVDTGSAREAGARPTFGEELALLSAARSALEAGDLTSCMRAVDRYDERFQAAGVFAPEIEVLRIQSLAGAGDHERARARATRFLATHAASPHAELVRSVLERISE